MTYYAIAPEGCSNYLTPGQRYEILGHGWDEVGLTDLVPFDPAKHEEFILDAVPTMPDVRLFCLVKGCYHARGDWTIEEVSGEG